jgi:leader peptidase (prepilin peptidase)/N-methyltransferase
MNSQGGPIAAWAGRYAIAGRDFVWCLAIGLAAAALLVSSYGLAAALASLYLLVAMGLVTVSDSRTMLVPDVLSLPAIAAGLAATLALVQPPLSALIDHALAALAAALLLMLLRWLYWRWRGAIGIGLGDVKLAAAAGAWVGSAWLPLVFSLATMAALLAALVASRRATGGRLAATTAVPLGSFLAPAIALIWHYRLLWP